MTQSNGTIADFALSRWFVSNVMKQADNSLTTATHKNTNIRTAISKRDLCLLFAFVPLSVCLQRTKILHPSSSSSWRRTRSARFGKSSILFQLDLLVTVISCLSLQSMLQSRRRRLLSLSLSTLNISAQPDLMLTKSASALSSHAVVSEVQLGKPPKEQTAQLHIKRIVLCSLPSALCLL